MAISNTASRNTYTLDSVTTDFDITFDCVFDDNGDATELTVWLIDSEGNRTEVTKGYASDQYSTAYKTVTYLDATSHAGETLLISRATPRTQLMDFVNNGAYNLNQVEAMSDKLTRIVQEQDDTIEDRIQTSEQFAESAKESAEAALASETAADTSAKDSEAYAIGTRGGTPVSSDDPAYHNNSKWYNDNIAQQTVTPDNAVTLINKTIDAKDNTIVCTATSITTSQTLTPTKQMMVTIDDTVTLTLGSGSYIGQELPVLAQTTCDVSYTGQDGASTDNLNAGDYITYVWQGTYWIVDASTYIKPTYISTSQTVTPTKAMLLVIDTTSVVLTLGNGMYDGFELPVLAQADCSIVYTGVNGTVTETREDGDYNVFVWNDSYWVPKQTTPITGIDDNGQPFAFNIDSMVREKGVINLTGTDADGNPFDYGLGRLVTNADEDNLVTGIEVKTSKTFDGKPVYEMVIKGTITTYVDGGSSRNFSSSFSLPNLSEMIASVGTYKMLNGSLSGITYSIGTGGGNLSTETYYRDSDSTVNTIIRTQVSWNITSIKLILTTLYTKTTD